MTDKAQIEDLQVFAASLQHAVVHMANLLVATSGVSHDAVAGTFEDSAAALPAQVHNRERLVLALQRVAQGIRSSQAGPDWDQLMARLRKQG